MVNTAVSMRGMSQSTNREMEGTEDGMFFDGELIVLEVAKVLKVKG